MRRPPLGCSRRYEGMSSTLPDSTVGRLNEDCLDPGYAGLFTVQPIGGYPTVCAHVAIYLNPVVFNDAAIALESVHTDWNVGRVVSDEDREQTLLKIEVADPTTDVNAPTLMA